MNRTPLLFLSLFASALLRAGSVSSLADEASLVVYTNNLGLVHERREASLSKGEQTLICNDIASTLIPGSVNVTFAEEVTLYSQQYKHDQITPQKLAQAHLGKSVKFYLQTESGLLYKSGILLSTGSQAVVQTPENEIYTVALSFLVFSDMPKELLTKPSLVWHINASKKSNSMLSLDYLLTNIAWESDYRLNISENHADLSGWITISNRSGKTFTQTSVSVLAGDINRAAVPLQRSFMIKGAAEMDAGGVQEFSREGYHLYPIPFKVTLANNESTQIRFLEINDIPVMRAYEVQLDDPLSVRGETSHAVSQYLEIVSLETPLPMGTIRSYSKVNGEMLLLGESRIGHTPIHQKVKVPFGKHFDLLVKEKMISDSSDRNYVDRKVSYEVINCSNEPKTIRLLVPFIKREETQSSVESPQKYQWIDGNLLAFDVLLKADSKKVFVARFRSRK